MDAKGILEARRKIVGLNVTLLFDEPIHMVRGEGVHLYDADGNEYLDTVNNVAHVGHCHPKVIPSHPLTSCLHETNEALACWGKGASEKESS